MIWRLIIRYICSMLPLLFDLKNKLTANIYYAIILLLSALLITGCRDEDNEDKQSTETHIIRTHIIADETLNVFTPDWGIAAELTALGYPPISTGDIRVYENWSGSQLPASTYDAGIRYLPNTELLAQLDLDVVIDNPFYEHLRPMYHDAKVKSVDIMMDGNTATWQQYADQVRQIATYINQPQAATSYIQKTEQQVIDNGRIFNQRYPQIKNIAIVQFASSSSLRINTKNSLFKPALNKMGLQLISTGKTTQWGFANIQLADLADLPDDTCVFVIEPYSPMLQQELKNSLVWQRLGYGKNRCFAVLSPIWAYGGLQSMLNFSKQLVTIDLQGISSSDASNTAVIKNTVGETAGEAHE